MENNSRLFFESSEKDTAHRKIDGPILIGVLLRTPNNIGSLIRVADNFNCKKVLFVDPNPDYRERNIRKTALNSFDAVDWAFCTLEELEDHIPKNYTRIAVETSPDATNLFDTNLPKDCAFFLGNEKVGMDSETISDLDQSIFIPMPGSNKSMNVSHAGAVIISEWLRQQLHS